MPVAGVLRFSLLLAFLAVCGFAKTIDNKLLGTPAVKCGPEAIEIKGATEEEFEGVLFIKNWRRTPGCFSAYERFHNASKTPTYTIPLGELARCGLELRRHPQTHELEVFTVFVFSFHPSFVTMSDRAFAVHCVFQQQTITVGTKFNFISDITTRATFTGVSEMPEPLLTIVPGRVPDSQLESAQRVAVGEPLMFVWNLTHSSEIYGIEVLDCQAATLDGRKMTIIQDGCTTDDIIISSVQYGDHNQKAFADAMAFKFPDAEDLWIKCSVRTCIQRHEHILIAEGVNENHLCKMDVDCDQRHKRSTDQSNVQAKLDGTDPSYTVINNKLQVVDLHSRQSMNQTWTSPKKAALVQPKPESETTQVCMLKSVYATSVAFLATLYLSTALSGGVLVHSLRRHKSALQRPRSNLSL